MAGNADPEDQLDLAIRHHQGGRPGQAEKIYKDILQAQPNHPDALHLLGVIMQQSGNSQGAVELINKAISIKTNFPQAHVSLGNVLKALGQVEKAVECYNVALAIDPGYVEGHYNLGNTFQDQGHLEDAVSSYQKALTIKPDYVDALHNLGNSLKELGRVEAATACCLKAISINPDYVEAFCSLGIVQLLVGDFQSGWGNYAYRWKSDRLSPYRRAYKEPIWDGRDFAGKTLFLYPEQGLGDFIQFSRYAALARAKGGRVMVEVPAELASLFSTIDGADVITHPGQPPEKFDFHAPLLDMPRLLGTTLQTIPASQSYIKAPSQLIDQWKNRLAPYEGLRVGLVWGGRPDHKNDKNRSIDPQQFKPLLDLTGINFFSLQVGRDGQSSATFGDDVVDLASHLTTFAQTAAVMTSLDVIISIDSSPVHLAAALGRATWTLLPFMPDWRWMLDRRDSPWYPTMRLFRQQKRGDWQAVIKCVHEALVNY